MDGAQEYQPNNPWNWDPPPPGKTVPLPLFLLLNMFVWFVCCTLCGLDFVQCDAFVSVCLCRCPCHFVCLNLLIGFVFKF